MTSLNSKCVYFLGVCKVKKREISSSCDLCAPSEKHHYSGEKSRWSQHKMVKGHNYDDSDQWRSEMQGEQGSSKPPKDTKRKGGSMKLC